MRRELFAAVSHDLRTPITALSLLATAIDDEVVEDAKRREYAARMNTHVRALGALIDDLFDLTRLQAQELQWTMERIAVEELVHDAVEAMRPAADAGSVAVRADLRPPLAASHGNEEQLRRVLFNLIQNAIRHTPPDGSVTVRAEDVDGGVEIEVADTGTGHRARAARPRVRPVLPRRRGSSVARRGARAGDRARDRRGARRRDLARGGDRRHPRPLPASPLSDADLDVRGARRLRQREEVAHEPVVAAEPAPQRLGGRHRSAGEDRRVTARAGQLPVAITRERIRRSSWRRPIRSPRGSEGSTLR